MERHITATVMRSTGSRYELLSDEGETFSARTRGRLRLSGSRSTSPVVVGDRVLSSLDESGEAWIEEILPRRNHMVRRSANLSRESHILAANIDRALVVVTLFSPATPTGFIDRFLVSCEAYGIPAAILLNKIDLASAVDPSAVRRFTDIYESAGYKVMTASALTGAGIPAVRDYLKEGTTLVSGNSGVGKSTLIKFLTGASHIRTGEVSRAHGKGTHTTTFSEIHPLPPGRIIDTPGIKGFGLAGIAAAELSRYFPEMMRLAPSCGYYNCTHTHEPDCAVLRALEEGSVSPERYASYLGMLEDDDKYRK